LVLFLRLHVGVCWHFVFKL